MKQWAILILVSIFLAGCIQNSTDQIKCKSNDPNKYYVGTLEECELIKFSCVTDFSYFSDECGCGCQKSAACPADAMLCSDGVTAVGRVGPNCEFAPCPEQDKIYCTPEQKNSDICTKEYNPVCGWFDSKLIQCIKYPCAQTFGNACEACSSENVEYYIKGTCPN